MEKKQAEVAHFLVDEPQVLWRFSEPGDMPPGLFFWADLPVENVIPLSLVPIRESAPFYTFVFDESKTARRLRFHFAPDRQQQRPIEQRAWENTSVRVDLRHPERWHAAYTARGELMRNGVDVFLDASSSPALKTTHCVFEPDPEADFPCAMSVSVTDPGLSQALDRGFVLLAPCGRQLYSMLYDSIMTTWPRELVIMVLEYLRAPDEANMYFYGATHRDPGKCPEWGLFMAGDGWMKIDPVNDPLCMELATLGRETKRMRRM
jgi:hypothetical protein